MLLMVVLDLECLKDLALYLSDFELHKSMWHWVNATDMVVVPVYTFVLMELVKPGWLSWRKAALHEASFLLPLVLYGITDKLLWFDVLTAWCFVYGTVTYFLMFYLFSRYHRQLKERFSYQDNINLNWLRGYFVVLLRDIVGLGIQLLYGGCSIRQHLYVVFFGRMDVRLLFPL